MQREVTLGDTTTHKFFASPQISLHTTTEPRACEEDRKVLTWRLAEYADPPCRRLSPMQRSAGSGGTATPPAADSRNTEISIPHATWTRQQTVQKRGTSSRRLHREKGGIFRTLQRSRENSFPTVRGKRTLTSLRLREQSEGNLLDS